jgi:c-di-GMP-binding flagellar brake protein YcgR
MIHETRKSPRSKIDLKVQCEIPEGDKQTFSLVSDNGCEMIATDIGGSGMGLVSEYFFPRGLIIQLKIEGKEFGLKENMVIKAKVCHSRHQGIQSYVCGVEFIDLSPQYKQAIAEFMAQHERRKFPRIQLAD